MPVLVENFDGDGIDRNKWEVYDSPDAEVNPRTARATSVHDGVLHMTGGFYGGKDLSGGVASHVSQTYGRWEVRFRGEAGAGYSLVTLLWPSSESRYAEIDFAEVIDPTRKSGGIYIHSGDAPQAQSQMAADFTQWHTVAVDWLPGRLTFWLDGRKTWDYTGPRVPEGQPMHLTLQNDVVCNEWSPCRSASTPRTVSMYVDWVKIYRAP
jgi:licheninase